MSSPTNGHNTIPSDLADDLLYGAEDIGKFIGRNARQVYHLVDKGNLPAGTIGTVLMASKRRIREHYAKLLNAAAD